MLTMDTGRSQKRTWRTSRTHPIARDRREPKAWISREAQTPKKASRRGGSQSPPGRKQLRLVGQDHFLGKGQAFSSDRWGWMALVLPEIQALSFHVGPGHCLEPRKEHLVAFKMNQSHDETQVRNKTTTENTFYVCEDSHGR